MKRYEKLAFDNHLIIVEKAGPNSKWGALIVGTIVYVNKDLTDVQKYERVREEVAHSKYTVGDISAEDTLDKCKQETFARSKAIEEAVPLDGLIECVNNQLLLSEFADHFGVTEKYLEDAIKTYIDKRGPNFVYNGYMFDLNNGINIHTA